MSKMPKTATEWLIYGLFNLACFFAPFLALIPDRRYRR
jgi:hypothetical protein